MNHIVRLLLVYALVSAPASSGFAQQKSLAPLPVADTVSAPSFGTTPLSLSSDGQWVAYELLDPKRTRLINDERYQVFRHDQHGTALAHIGSDIWITNTAGETTNLTKGIGSNWAPAWSPNGKYLAFFSDRGGKAGLWIWERSSSRQRQLSDAIVVSYRGLAVPRWMPDSKRVLFSALPQGMTIEEAATLASGFPKPEPIDQTKAVAKATVSVYRSQALPKQLATLDRAQLQTMSTYIKGYFADLVLADVVSSRSTRIARRQKPSGYWPSPDGSHVAFTDLTPDGGQSEYDLVVVNLRTGAQKVVAKNIVQGFVGFAVSWSPDGKLLAFTHNDSSSQSGAVRRDCYVVNANGDGPRKVTNMAHPSFTQALRPPLWDATGTHLFVQTANALWTLSLADSSAREVTQFPGQLISGLIAATQHGQVWSPDGGRSIVVSLTDLKSGKVGFAKVDVANGKATKILEEDKAYGGLNVIWDRARGAAGERFVYTAEDVGHRQEVWVTNALTSESRQMSRLTPTFEKYVMGKSRVIEWTGMDGQKLSGALLLPAGYEPGKRYPMIVWSYPDHGFAADVNRFGLVSSLTPEENGQLLATRGYAVLFADSTTRVGTHMQDVARTILPAVDKVIELGIADPERLGVIGHSHGGYNALALIVQTNRFKAAICYAGGGNLTSMYGQMDRDGNSHWQSWAEIATVKLGGTLWDYRDRYVENSPVFFFDRVETPLLIVQGANDLTTLPIYADEIFVDLKRLGKEVEYARYDGEDHGLVGYANKVDFADRVIAWFDKHLKR